MKILRRERAWIHTHFVTDCLQIRPARMREIIGEMTPTLRELGIVVGLHFAQPEGRDTVDIVLECIPEETVLDYIEVRLRDVVKHIPRKPEPVAISIPKRKPKKGSDKNALLRDGGDLSPRLHVSKT